MAHRPIAIDGAGADGSAEGAGGVKPGQSKDHGGDGTCIDRVVVPTTPPRPSALDKDAVHHRVTLVHYSSERAPASQAPQIPALGVEIFYGVREGGTSQHLRLHNIYVSGTYAR